MSSNLLARAFIEANFCIDFLQALFSSFHPVTSLLILYSYGVSIYLQHVFTNRDSTIELWGSRAFVFALGFIGVTLMMISTQKGMFAQLAALLQLCHFRFAQLLYSTGLAQLIWSVIGSVYPVSFNDQQAPERFIQVLSFVCFAGAEEMWKLVIPGVGYHTMRYLGLLRDITPNSVDQSRSVNAQVPPTPEPLLETPIEAHGEGDLNVEALPVLADFEKRAAAHRAQTYRDLVHYASLGFKIAEDMHYVTRRGPLLTAGRSLVAVLRAACVGFLHPTTAYVATLFINDPESLLLKDWLLSVIGFSIATGLHALYNIRLSLRIIPVFPTQS